MAARVSKSAAARLGLAVPKTGKRGPNKLEAAYMAYLASVKGNGYVIAFGFEEIKLKIGVGICWFCPDFWVLTKDGLAFHECKGFFRDDAKVKIKAAALKYPQFKFYLVKKIRDEWCIQLLE